MWCWDCIQQSMTVAWAHVVLGLYIAEYDGGVGPCGAGTVYSRVSRWRGPMWCWDCI